jgi:ribosome-binding protein aMBF1 (putative translation factor)
VRRRRNSGSQPSPGPDEIVRSTEVAIIEQLQEQIEAAMEEGGLDRDDLAGALGVTRAMVELLLDGPGARLHDLAAVASMLGIGFRIERYQAGG